MFGRKARNKNMGMYFSFVWKQNGGGLFFFVCFCFTLPTSIKYLLVSFSACLFNSRGGGLPRYNSGFCPFLLCAVLGVDFGLVRFDCSFGGGIVNIEVAKCTQCTLPYLVSRIQSNDGCSRGTLSSNSAQPRIATEPPPPEEPAAG
ncbi:hypothetical protein B0T22DRAFT_133644 [Podospora appendiculata]|uniref:Uncharacterized protein n=1 Tax=Podospora appendiculata TaxID=314037 RepID=A0AAE0X7S6_9PEZI|nr:hypothetical protein B0T22DRAFT_133644 [Podospora appendiculata]